MERGNETTRCCSLPQGYLASVTIPFEEGDQISGVMWKFVCGLGLQQFKRLGGVNEH
jgi:hypothetical protein